MKPHQHNITTYQLRRDPENISNPLEGAFLALPTMKIIATLT
jgi:hypothetical protein